MQALEAALEGFMYYLRVEANRSPHTVEAYQRDLMRFVRFCQEHDVDDPATIPREMVSDHLVALEGAGLGLRSIARARSSIRQLFRFLVREGHLDQDPRCMSMHPDFRRHCRRCFPGPRSKRCSPRPPRILPLGCATLRCFN